MTINGQEYELAKIPAHSVVVGDHIDDCIVSSIYGAAAGYARDTLIFSMTNPAHPRGGWNYYTTKPATVRVWRNVATEN